MRRFWFASVFALPMLISCPDGARALPILPGNEHSHGVDDVTWPDGPLADPSHTMHQHWNNKELGRNFFEDSFFTLAAWDNRGTTTTYHIEPALNQGLGARVRARLHRRPRAVPVRSRLPGP